MCIYRFTTMMGLIYWITSYCKREIFQKMYNTIDEEFVENFCQQHIVFPHQCPVSFSSYPFTTALSFTLSFYNTFLVFYKGDMFHCVWKTSLHVWWRRWEQSLKSFLAFSSWYLFTLGSLSPRCRWNIGNDRMKDITVGLLYTYIQHIFVSCRKKITYKEKK